jgi:hypothetical protein
MTIDPLNRTNASMLAKFFDTCFRHGVMDACAVEDDYAVRAFVAKHQFHGSFGVLGDELDYDWRMFRFVLYRWAREEGMPGLAENYILQIRVKNYLWCLLPYCMWFYLMGAKEWLEYPSAPALEMFKQDHRIHWNPKAKVKKFKLPDYISYMHEAAYDYRRVPEDERQISTAMMDNYCMAVYDLTRRHGR